VWPLVVPIGRCLVSGHLIGCAGRTELPTSHKLALVAFSDSADDRTHIGFPGYEGVMAWACCSRGRAAELIRDLVEWGYLRQHKRGHRGQRAEYVVFPDGCCDMHRVPVAEPQVDVEQLARAAGVSLEQARLMLTALGTGSPVNGSDTPDAMTGNGSDVSDPNDGTPSTPVGDGVDNAGKGPESVQRSRSQADSFTPSTNSPLPPAASGRGCPKHQTTHPNCRGCGTTARQQAARARKAAAEQHRREQQRLAAEQREARANSTRPPADLRERVAAAAAQTEGNDDR
jgi:hypothetical protein